MKLRVFARAFLNLSLYGTWNPTSGQYKNKEIIQLHWLRLHTRLKGTPG